MGSNATNRDHLWMRDIWFRNTKNVVSVAVHYNRDNDDPDSVSITVWRDHNWRIAVEVQRRSPQGVIPWMSLLNMAFADIKRLLRVPTIYVHIPDGGPHECLSHKPPGNSGEDCPTPQRQPPILTSEERYVAQARAEQTDTLRRPIRAGIKPRLMGRILPGGIMEVMPCR